MKARKMWAPKGWERVRRRLWAAVVPEPNTGCWIWARHGNSDGYGSMRVGGAEHRVHRLSYRAFVGPFDESLFVCHSCDTPACINPDHLWVGSHADNQRDKARKERSPDTKLTTEDVVAIRSTHERSAVLARRYDVDTQTVVDARSGVTWGHLPGATEDYPRRRVLDEDMVREILLSNESERAIARRLGVSRGAVTHVRARRTWRHIHVEGDS